MNRKVMILENEMDLQEITATLKSENYDISSFRVAENFYYMIENMKPQLILIPYSKKTIKFIKKVIKNYSFLPTILYSQDDIEIKWKTENVCTLKLPTPSESFKKMLNDIHNTSVAEEIIWPEQRRIQVEMNKMTLIKRIIKLTTILIVLFLLSIPLRKLPILSKKVTSVQLPYSYPTTFAYEKEHLWVCSWHLQSLYKHKLDEKLSLEKIYYLSDFPLSLLTILSISKEKLICAYSPLNKKLFLYKLQSPDLAINSFEFPIFAPLDFASRGKELWVATGGGGVYRCSIDDKVTILSSWHLPYKEVDSLFCYGDFVYLLDSRRYEIYKCRVENFPKIESVIFLQDFHPKKINDFIIRENKIWLCVEGEPKIYKFKFKEWKRY